MLGEMLSPLGVEVEAIPCPATALQTFIQKRKYFDLVLLDYYMPDMNGEQMLDWLRQLDPQIRIILCSVADEDRLQQIVAAKRANAYIHKPFHCEDLVRIVANTLACASPEA